MMRYMSRFYKCLSLLLLALVCNDLHGQQTFYYKYTKSIEHGAENTAVSGGQFITFKESSCYDSDINGNSVKNGILNYYKEYSHNHPTYIGESYYGNVTYRFSADYQTLNIIVNKSLIYVYKRAPVPNNVVTSSLIKKQKANTNPWNQIPSFGGSYNTSINNPPTNETNSQNYSKEFEQKNKEWREQHYGDKECHLCHGSGICRTCNGKGWYTNPLTGNPLECPNCDKNRKGICSVCHGKGSVYGPK